MGEVFEISGLFSQKKGLTISRSSRLGEKHAVTYFYLGAGCDISPESYDSASVYIAAGGKGVGELIKENGECSGLKMKPGDLAYIPGGQLFGKAAAGEEGFSYVEIIIKGGHKMNEIVKAGEVFALKELIDYEKDSVANVDLIGEEDVKLMLLSFDEGTGLEEHRAPGDALVFALEGRAVISYEGVEHRIEAGQNFRFEKNGLHSLRADGRFKMALLLIKK